MSLLEQALEFSIKYHKDHTRLTGEPVWDHCQRVMQILKEEGINDEKLLVVASLHHVLRYDDSKEMQVRLENSFGSTILSALIDFNELTKRKIKRSTTKDAGNQFIVQSFLNLTHDTDILVIRLADKLDNLNYSFNYPPESRNRLAQRVLEIYSPVARFLGLSGFVNKLEDQAFKILYPADYYRITHYIASIQDDVSLLFQDSKLFIEDLCAEHGIPNQVKFRIKKPYSIYKKELLYLSKGVMPVANFSHLPDILAMRVLVDTVEQCYIVDSLLRGVWSIIEEHTHDLIVNPRPSGYMSLHSLFKISSKFNIEVQIRTFEMHEVNEFGVASHLFYKAGGTFRKKLLNDPDWLRKLNYWEKDIAFDTTEGTKEKPFSTKIYTFTPKGDIIELDRGATVIDFAYAVHEDIGRNFTGCLVNGVIAKESYILNDGDVVEIKASKKQKLPSRDWLEFVKTSKARTHIRKELKI